MRSFRSHDYILQEDEWSWSPSGRHSDMRRYGWLARQGQELDRAER